MAQWVYISNAIQYLERKKKHVQMQIQMHSHCMCEKKLYFFLVISIQEDGKKETKGVYKNFTGTQLYAQLLYAYNTDMVIHTSMIVIFFSLSKES